jgi:hypothetical protein
MIGSNHLYILEVANENMGFGESCNNVQTEMYELEQSEKVIANTPKSTRYSDSF